MAVVRVAVVGEVHGHDAREVRRRMRSDWSDVKPPYEMPIMFTWPEHHGWVASHSIAS
jgi:hypothetical protein